jgi:hypothetical protein
MGLLDDAIREHLDLKRRRGADPTEIERAEREALGPVRRGPEVSGGDAAAAEVAEAPDARATSAPTEQWDPFDKDAESHGTEPMLEPDDELPPYEPDDHLAAEEPAAGARPFDLEEEPAPPPDPADVAPAVETEPGLAPHPADPPPPTTPAQLDQETEEYELEPTEDEEGNDVLESTPEFLQDAPDHDRLWFEQRPPRDFDFDG